MPPRLALATAAGHNDFRMDVTRTASSACRSSSVCRSEFQATTGLECDDPAGWQQRQRADAAPVEYRSRQRLPGVARQRPVDNITIDGELRLKVKGPISAVDPLAVAIEAGDAILEAAGDDRWRHPRRQLALARQFASDTAPRRPTATAASPHRAAGAVNVADTDDVKVGGIFFARPHQAPE